VKTSRVASRLSPLESPRQGGIQSAQGWAGWVRAARPSRRFQGQGPWAMGRRGRAKSPSIRRDGEGTKALTVGLSGRRPISGGIVKRGWNDPPDQGERAKANDGGGATATHLAECIATHFLPAPLAYCLLSFRCTRGLIMADTLLYRNKKPLACIWLINLLWDNPETLETLISMRIATAEWANPALVEQNYAFDSGMVWLGRSCSENNAPIGYRDDRHVCLVSGSRGGKGTTSIVNNLLVWPGSLCVIDPKGENATIAAARRGRGSDHAKGLGQDVRVLDPFKAAQIDNSLRGRFNPLDALDPEDEETIDEAGRIADAIVVIHESNDPFWDESARAMVKGLILHLLTAPEYEGRRNLVMLRKLIMRGDWEAVEALRSAGDHDIPPAHGLLWTALANNPAFDGLVAGIGESFTNMLVNSPKQYESVLQVANRNTEFIDSPPMQRCLEASDFRISDLKTNPQGLSVFLCLPQRYMSTHYRWLRMMIALTVTEMEKVRGRPATNYPVLLMLDEFAGLKRMEVIEQAVAQIAGYGVKMFFVLQSLEQLKAVYKDNWETFLANSGLKVFFNLEDHFSRDYVSKLIGETEVVREVRSASDSVSESESISRSTTQSQSHTRGRSSSAGTSDTHGTNSSDTRGHSWGKSRSVGWNWGRSESRSWTPGFLFDSYRPERTKNESSGESVTKSKSEGWNTSHSEGISRSKSRSRTEGTSESWTTGTSETEGITRGTSQSWTKGTSETIQKRALITPDEIGQVFARVDERDHIAYPGLALVVISGARPVTVCRVNYFEDLQFMRLFDPHPDHPFIEPKELMVDGRSCEVLLADFGLSLAGWCFDTEQIIQSNAAAIQIANTAGTIVAHIRTPHAGVISQQLAEMSAGTLLQSPLFSLLYYEDGIENEDPFEELRELCARLLRAADLRRIKEIAIRRRRLVLSAVLAASLVAAAVISSLWFQRQQRIEKEQSGLPDHRIFERRPQVTTPTPTSPPTDGPTRGENTTQNGKTIVSQATVGTNPQSSPNEFAAQIPSGVITPGDDTRATGPIPVEICVPNNMDQYLWTHPDNRMSQFHDAVYYAVKKNVNRSHRFLIQPDAYAKFNNGYTGVRDLIWITDLSGCPSDYDSLTITLP
jgi:type IV secretory pathway TraG/TraD family ATPase VirD4